MATKALDTVLIMDTRLLLRCNRDRPRRAALGAFAAAYAAGTIDLRTRRRQALDHGAQKSGHALGKVDRMAVRFFEVPDRLKRVPQHGDGVLLLAQSPAQTVGQRVDVLRRKRQKTCRDHIELKRIFAAKGHAGMADAAAAGAVTLHRLHRVGEGNGWGNSPA